MKARIITFVCVLTAVGVLAVRRQARLRNISASIPAATQPQRVIAPPTSEPAKFTVTWLPADPDEHQLISVLLLGDQVFATTDRGIYRASLSEREWLVAFPSPMPPGGHFAAERTDAKVLYYSAASLTNPEASGGIWRSKDYGNSWGQVSDQVGVCHMLLLPNGVLYATPLYRVLMSTDGGWGWQNITHNGPGLPRGLMEDPEHKDLVRVIADGTMRQLEWVAKDDHYDWQTHFELSGNSGDTRELFMNTLNGYLAYQHQCAGEVFGVSTTPDRLR